MDGAFGRLRVIKEIEHDKPGKWLLLRCECGAFVARSLRLLRATVKRGSSPCCLDCFRARSRVNGLANNKGKCSSSHKRLYDVHRQMMRRCYDKRSADFKNYGARGVAVCAEWHDTKSFIAWAESTGYEQGLTIERTDVNGDYCPSNCCWIVNERQAHNTRKVRRISIGGETRILSEWAELSGISVHTIKGRLSRGWLPERAVFERVAP